MSRSEIIKANHYRVYIDDDLRALSKFISHGKYSAVIVLTDNNTRRLCFDELVKLLQLKNIISLTIEAGESSKSLSSANKLWQQMMPVADRKSLMVNLGGGMITDIGAFVASVYKRGIDFVNVPTTLLAMVDAAVGSKCGVDFENQKNQLGLFSHPAAVFISMRWLNTLSSSEILSGKAEMIKHAILGGTRDWENFVLSWNNPEKLKQMICNAVKFKLKITDADLTDRGERKQLNLGHTIGHAIESFFLKNNNPVPHGYAVASGIICELKLSEFYFNLKYNPFGEQIDFIKENYPELKISNKEVDEVISFLFSDKKNERLIHKPVLMKRCGKPYINKGVDTILFKQVLQLYSNHLI